MSGTSSTPRHDGAHAPGERVRDFLSAQQRLLERYGVAAERRTVPTASTGGRAQVLVTGEGPPLPLVIGGGIPAAFWIPLLPGLTGRTLLTIELPGFGLTDPVRYEHATLRRTAVRYLTEVLDGLGLGPGPVVTQSMGSLWTTWLAEDDPGRVSSQVMIACPAFFPGTSAILPFRLASVPGVGSLMSRQPATTAAAERILRTVGEDPEGLEEIRDVLVATQRLPAYAASLVGLMRAVMSWTRPRRDVVLTADQLRRFRHPVRLIWGEHDAFGSPEAGRRGARLIPDADFHVVPGGHAPWFHATERVAALTRDFLDRHPAGSRAS